MRTDKQKVKQIYIYYISQYRQDKKKQIDSIFNSYFKNLKKL